MSMLLSSGSITDYDVGEYEYQYDNEKAFDFGATDLT